MARKILPLPSLGILLLSLVFSQFLQAGSNEELTAEKLIVAHLKSIGNPAVLKKIQSLTFVGTSEVEFIQGMHGKMAGNSMFVSQGPRIGVALKFADPNYPGEYFAYDGKDVTVGHMSPGQKSPIAEFIFRYNRVLKDGMLGGVLSGSWPLLDAAKALADSKCRKTKIEDRELYELEYRPKDSLGLMKVRMYFDPATFRHVRTEYKVQVRDDASARTEAPADIDDLRKQFQQISEARADSYYTLVEKFDEFKKVGGLTLPHRYVLDYQLEGSGHAFIANWTQKVAKWGFNAQNLDPKIFQAQK